MDIKCYILKICDDFVKHGINVQEFQNRLETISVEDGNYELLHILKEANNQLEDIIFCSEKCNFYNYGLNVVDFLKKSLKVKIN